MANQNVSLVLEKFENTFKLIAAQDQGCGGNLSPTEIYKAMQKLALDAIETLPEIRKFLFNVEPSSKQGIGNWKVSSGENIMVTGKPDGTVDIRPQEEHPLCPECGCAGGTNNVWTNHNGTWSLCDRCK